MSPRVAWYLLIGLRRTASVFKPGSADIPPSFVPHRVRRLSSGVETSRNAKDLMHTRSGMISGY